MYVLFYAYVQDFMKSVLFPYIVNIIMLRFGSIISRLSLYAGRGFLVGRGGGGEEEEDFCSSCNMSAKFIMISAFKEFVDASFTCKICYLWSYFFINRHGFYIQDEDLV